jgi:hypothetical protein
VGHSKIPIYLSVSSNEQNNEGVSRDSCFPSQYFYVSHVAARNEMTYLRRAWKSIRLRMKNVNPCVSNTRHSVLRSTGLVCLLFI